MAWHKPAYSQCKRFALTAPRFEWSRFSPGGNKLDALCTICPEGQDKGTDKVFIFLYKILPFCTGHLPGKPFLCGCIAPAGESDCLEGRVQCPVRIEHRALIFITFATVMKVHPELKTYIEAEILPRYRNFDKAHRTDHIETVIGQSSALADRLAAEGAEVNGDMVYVIAAYHDLGLAAGRENHHTDSGRILAADPVLARYFTAEQIRVMQEAVEDHRASSKHAPRSLYGRIVAEADRQIDPRTIVQRTLQYGVRNCPDLDKAGHFERAEAHLHEKYGEGGYLKLWFPESDNARRLEELRTMLKDRQALYALMEDIWIHEV